MSKFFDVALSSWQPEANTVLHRVAPRHPLDRSWNYEDRFDFFTLVYDVFWSEDGTSILLICPPPLNLQQKVFNGHYHEFPSGKIITPSVLTTGPIHIFTFAVSPGTQAIRLESLAGIYFLTPQPNLSRELENQRLIVTVSKNNELHWIRDWLYFHVKMHGCTGVIFYDNGSDRYTIYEVADAVKDVPGLETVVTVTTTSPYGVNNGPYGVNDSRYLTRGVLEHAKYRLARRASGLMHIDVDELVVSPERENVFEAVETSSTGYISFEGIWVERVTDDGEELSVEELSHSKFRYVAAGGGRSSLRKTAIAPNRVDDGVYMTTHRAYGARPDYAKGDRFKHRHFIGLKTVATNIKNKERLQQEPFRKFDEELHQVDPVLAGQLEECFGSEDYKQFIRNLSEVDPDPDVLRRMGGVAFGKGNYEGAIRLTEQAISRRPNYPSYYQFLARCLEQIGRQEEAEEAQNKAKSFLSESPEVRVASIKELRRNGNFEAALTSVQQLLSEFPANADVCHEHGEVLARMGRRDQAEAAFRKSVELDASNPRLLWRWASQLYRNRDFDSSMAAFRQMLEHAESGFADKVRAYQGIRTCLEHMGRFGEASAVSRVALEHLGSHAKMTTAIRSDFEEASARLAAAERETSDVGPATQTVRNPRPVVDLEERSKRQAAAEERRASRQERLQRREAAQGRRASREERRLQHAQRVAERNNARRPAASTSAVPELSE